MGPGFSLGRQSCLRPTTTLVITPHDGGREQQHDGVNCVHCNRFWLLGDALAIHLGGRAEFGWCGRCGGVTCPGNTPGSPDCHRQCCPEEQQLENMEAGRPLLWQPVRVSFAGVPLLGQRG